MNFQFLRLLVPQNLQLRNVFVSTNIQNLLIENSRETVFRRLEVTTSPHQESTLEDG